MLLAVAVPATEPTVDPALIAACGQRPSVFCEGAWDLTHNRFVARATDWLVTKPLAALVVFLVALLLSRWLRRLVTGVIDRVTHGGHSAAAALSKLGRDRAPLISDPRVEQRSTTLSVVARAGVSVVVWAIASLTILGIYHVNLGPLLAGAGIAGFAVGLGAQSLVKDCIAGFFIILEDQFGVGDDVDLGPASGAVEALTLRATLLRSADGTLWSIPNGTIMRVANQSKLWSNALVDVTVWHGAGVEQATEIVAAAAHAVCERPNMAALVLDPPQVLGVERFTPEGFVIRVTVRTKPGSQGSVMRELRSELKTAFDTAGVAMFKPVAGGEAPPDRPAA